jgi:hypothetical protein
MGMKSGGDPGPRRAAGYAAALVRHGARLSTLADGAWLAMRSRGGRLPPEEFYYRQDYLWAKIETDVFCRLVELDRLDFGSLIYTLTDSLGRKYWRYYERGLFGGEPSPEVKRYGEVIPGAYRLVDQGIARLARRVGPAGFFAVISDHGVGAATTEGILLLHGAGVRRGAEIPASSVLDLVPTALTLLGLPVGADMDGRVLDAALEPSYLAAHPVTVIATYDTPENLPRLTAEPEKEMPPDVIK